VPGRALLRIVACEAPSRNRILRPGPAAGQAFGDLLMRAAILALTLNLASLATPARGQAPATLKPHGGWVGAVAFSPDGKTLVAASADGTITFWGPDGGKPVLASKAHKGPISALAFTPDGKALASAGFDRTVRLWGLAPGATGAVTLRGHKGVVTSVAFSPDGKTLASGSVDGSVRLWDVDSCKGVAELRRHTSWVNAVAFAPDGTLASAGSDNRVILWARQGKDWQPRKTFTVPEGEVRSVAFAPGGKTLAAGLRYGTVRVWDVARGKSLAKLKEHASDVWAVAFSPDGKRLASGDGDWDRPGEVRLHDTRSWTRQLTLAHTGEVLCVAFSPDGRRLAAGSWDRTVRVWDTQNLPGAK
jgi:WD40 repeat protein